MDWKAAIGRPNYAIGLFTIFLICLLQRIVFQDIRDATVYFIAFMRKNEIY
jgi:hypothetical protein